ncbi:trypsin-like cysteine/serine peptidase domain-containing protein [Xylogone sp. PMI_703]|nr:trypsin-like cysteine/serine peptidase domain-containing protein [Xylogone sp. PMI_703]
MAPVLALASALTVLPALVMGASIPRTEDLVARAGEIVGGTAAQLGEFPYIVSLSQSGSHFCGGVLINARTVVTAAHCSVGTSPSSVRVRAGTLTWASGGTQVGVSSILVNPSYNSRLTDNDVAVWHLSSSLPQSSTIGYATLPAQGEDPAAGSTVTTAGWGVTSENSGSLPSRLNKVSVPVVSRASCRADYGTSAITNNMFCAGLTQGGKDSCSGDSGGPIIDASSGVLVGLVSWGQGCAEAGFPGVYTRLGNYVDFINANLA